MTTRAKPAVRRVPEKVVQAQIVRLLRSIGFRVWVTGTRRPRSDAYHGTCITAGLPDVLAFGRGLFVFIEVKAKGGRLRPEQQAFAEECSAAYVEHVIGGLNEVVDWLVKHGCLRDRDIAHYRRQEDQT